MRWYVPVQESFSGPLSWRSRAKSELLIRSAQPADIPALAALRATLWPEGSVDEHAQELEAQARRTAPSCLVSLVLDGGALSALERNDRAMWRR
jgi:hypothetical protein